jgi:hypothetical protein
MRGHLTYNPETRVAQVECGQNGCNAASTCAGIDAIEEVAYHFQMLDWRQDDRCMWLCGKHPAAPNPPNSAATQPEPLAARDGGAS